MYKILFVSSSTTYVWNKENDFYILDYEKATQYNTFNEALKELLKNILLKYRGTFIISKDNGEALLTIESTHCLPDKIISVLVRFQTFNENQIETLCKRYGSDYRLYKYFPKFFYNKYKR